METQTIITAFLALALLYRLMELLVKTIKILWNECGFCVNENYSTDIWTLEKWDAEHFQVCGNIFDNPDLLEVE